MENIASLDATQIVARLGDLSLSSQEVTEFFLRRISKFNPELNAFITVLENSAFQKAEEADSKIKKGKCTAITGLPIAHKDLFCTSGILTTCGSKMLSNFIPPYNATVVERLNVAGTILLGKLNMDEFAMGSSNETSYFGPAKNPWDKERTPGGSSGGAACAVAAKLAPVVTATDTGGSIRQPCSLTGTCGIKPTYGRVSRHGMIAFASSFDQGGIIGQSASDLALLLGVISGYDPKDSTSSTHSVPDYFSEIKTQPKNLTLGIPDEYFDSNLPKIVRKRLDDVIELLNNLGHTIKRVSLPNINLSLPAYYVIAPAEASSNLARYDGIRYGHRALDSTNLVDLISKSRSEGFGMEVKRRIIIGTYSLSHGYYEDYYRKAQKIRRLISNDFNSVFLSCDLIFAPSTASTAFRLGDKPDPVEMYLEDVYTVGANMAGLPAGSFQAGLIDELPIGFQFIGKAFDESLILQTAHQVQQSSSWHLHTPELRFEKLTNV